MPVRGRPGLSSPPRRPGRGRLSRSRRSGSISTSRSASRCARTATSRWSPAGPPAGLEPDPGVRGRSPRRAGPARGRDGRGSRIPAAARHRLPGGRHAVAAGAGRGGWAAAPSRPPVRHRPWRRDHARGQPWTGRTGRSGGLPRGWRHAVLAGCPEPAARGAAGARPAARPGDVAAAVAEARAAGFASVSLDLLTDIPGQTPSSWQRTLEETVALAPDHVSAYALTLEDPMPMASRGRAATTSPCVPARAAGGSVPGEHRTRTRRRRWTR